MSKISDASEVIADYCETDGANNYGGTGLKDPATLAGNKTDRDLKRKKGDDHRWNENGNIGV